MFSKRLLALTLLAALAVMSPCVLRAQPAIQWQKCLGGSETDIFYYAAQTTDGGYVLAGSTNSNDSEVSGNHGGEDALVAKLDATGSLQWLKCYGGSKDDAAFNICATSDGGSIFCGTTASNDGDVSGNHGYRDAWVVKLSSNGSMQWQKCYGGSYDDLTNSIIQTTDGGFILAGGTGSNDGDVSGNHGAFDEWVLKLSSVGSIQWQKCLGGSGTDYSYSVVQTKDGGYMVAGTTTSNDDEVSGNHGRNDAWVVKLNVDGTIKWQKCFGGTQDEYAPCIIQTDDGGFAFTGYTYSNNGDVSGNHGGMDAWTVKLDSIGTLQWQRCDGGSNDDWTNSIVQIAKGEYVIAGHTYSSDGEITGNHGCADSWIVMLDSSGSTFGRECIGGSDTDDTWSVFQTTDGGYILAGETNSNNDEVSGNHGGYDAWVVKLCSFPSSQVSTRDVSTDTIGGTVYMPIIGYTDSIDKGLQFVLGYDTSLLVYRGSISHSGDTLDVPGAGWPGHAEILLDSTALSDDTLAGYAVFDVLPQSSEASTLVTFDSLTNNNPCASTQSIVASNVGLPHGCGIPILTNFMLDHGIPPLFKVIPNPFSQSTQISFTSQSAGYADISIVNQLGEQVARLFSGELGAGEHSFLWSTPIGLPAGTYECLVRFNGQVDDRSSTVQALPLVLMRN